MRQLNGEVDGLANRKAQMEIGTIKFNGYYKGFAPVP